MAWLGVKNRFQKDMCSDTRKTTRLEYGFFDNIGDLEHLSDTSEEDVCILEETLKYTMRKNLCVPPFLVLQMMEWK